MLHALTWLFRAGGAVLIGAATFGYSAASGRDLVTEAVAFAIGAVVVAYWLVTDLRPGAPAATCLRRRPDRDGRGIGLRQHGRARGPLIGFAFMAGDRRRGG